MLSQTLTWTLLFLLLIFLLLRYRALVALGSDACLTFWRVGKRELAGGRLDVTPAGRCPLPTQQLKLAWCPRSSTLFTAAYGADVTSWKVYHVHPTNHLHPKHIQSHQSHFKITNRVSCPILSFWGCATTQVSYHGKRAIPLPGTVVKPRKHPEFCFALEEVPAEGSSSSSAGGSGASFPTKASAAASASASASASRGGGEGGPPAPATAWGRVLGAGGGGVSLRTKLGLGQDTTVSDAALLENENVTCMMPG